MNTKIERFFTFIMKEKTRNFFAFAFYISTIIMIMELDLPVALNAISYIIQTIIYILTCSIYMTDWMNKVFEINRNDIKNIILKKLKKISKEIVMFLPILLISHFLTSFIMLGNSTNQTSIMKSFYEMPIFNSILMIIIGPIMEEVIFRSLPYKFIKNKTLYIIISAVIFAAMHVIHDPNPFYYIWFYMLRSLYYSYRYHKTQDIWITISLHSLNNLIATLLFIVS